jgi:hypothetical protein
MSEVPLYRDLQVLQVLSSDVLLDHFAICFAS